MSASEDTDASPVNKMLQGLRLHIAADVSAAKLLVQLFPDASSYEQLVATVLVPRSEARIKTRVRVLIDAAARAIGRYPTLHEWASALYTNRQSRHMVRGPALIAERVHFLSALRKIRAHVILLPEVVAAIHAQVV